MPLTVRWDDPDLTILYYTVTGEWTWDEFHATIDQGRNMREQRGPSPVTVVMDFSGTRYLPSGALSHFSSLFQRGTPSTDKVERMIIVKPSGLLSAIGDLLMKLYPKIGTKTTIVSSPAEVYTLLSQPVPQNGTNV